MIETQIGRNPFDRKRMGVLRGGGKEARTRYRVHGDASATRTRPFASLIECRLETGRTHQIRVHLTHLGHPLIGDPPLWPRAPGAARQNPRRRSGVCSAANFPRQALHAFVLGFQHPSLHKTMRFESPWPADFAGLVAALRGLKNPLSRIPFLAAFTGCVAESIRPAVQALKSRIRRADAGIKGV